MLAGLLFHFTGICPVVKRIWTPAWTLYSGGVCFFFLAAFSWVIEVKGYKKWAFPLVVVGINSIAAYLIAHLFGAVHCRFASNQPGCELLRLSRRRPAALAARRSHAADLLAYSVLDVPPQAVPKDMRRSYADSYQGRR